MKLSELWRHCTKKETIKVVPVKQKKSAGLFVKYRRIECPIKIAKKIKVLAKELRQRG